MAVTRANEQRGRPRAVLLAIALVSGYLFGVTNLIQTAPSGTALWIEICARLIGVVLIAVSSNAAWHLARNRAVRFSFTVYAFVMVALVVLGVVLVAKGGS